jgi:hypothetical protein
MNTCQIFLCIFLNITRNEICTDNNSKHVFKNAIYKLGSHYFRKFFTKLFTYEIYAPTNKGFVMCSNCFVFQLRICQEDS